MTRTPVDLPVGTTFEHPEVPGRVVFANLRWSQFQQALCERGWTVELVRSRD